MYKHGCRKNLKYKQTKVKTCLDGTIMSLAPIGSRAILLATI